MRRALTVAVTGSLAIALVLGAAVALGPRSSQGTSRERAGAPVTAEAVGGLATATLPAAIAGLQGHLRAQPRDAAGWATLGVAYVEQARLSADPTYYPKAQGVLDRSLQLGRRTTTPRWPGWVRSPRHDTTSPRRSSSPTARSPSTPTDRGRMRCASTRWSSSAATPRRWRRSAAPTRPNQGSRSSPGSPTCSRCTAVPACWPHVVTWPPPSGTASPW